MPMSHQAFCFVLRWQLSPTQINCTYNANLYTYILNGFLIKKKKNKEQSGFCFMIMQMFIFEIIIFVLVEKTSNGPHAPCMALSPQMGQKKTPGGI